MGSDTGISPEPEEVLEVDEMWSYVATRKTPSGSGLFYAAEHARSSRGCGATEVPTPVGAFACQLQTRLLLAAYKKVLSPEQHQACTKQEGQTNHIERLNLTVRQRLARFVRKTLSFSKSLFMHIVVLRLFFYAYDQQQAQRYKASYTT